MKRFIIILLVLLIVSPLALAEKRAFLVGISKYKTDWKKIHGGEDVELLKPVLTNQGFRVTTLTNKQATRDGIIKGLESFINNIQRGDIVYIHFSTHGQPVEDGMNGLGCDEADGWDEAIVPYDAGSRYSINGYDGSKHITDDEINSYVSKIRLMIGPKGALYVVMDACHAGNLSYEKSEVTRGINEGLSRSGKQYRFDNAENKQYYRLPRRSTLAPALFLEACTSKERNNEIRINDKKYYGSLSYMVYLTILKNKIDTIPANFENAVTRTIKGSRYWPKKQHVVTEKSY